MEIRKSFITPKAAIKTSKTHGKGLYALETINEGDVVITFGGNYGNKQDAKNQKSLGKIVMQWDENLYSWEDRGDDLTYFINHSCDSNLWMQDAYTLVCRKKISQNEEITVDYALWENDPNWISAWDCKCGSKQCRKKISGNDWKMKEVQEKYTGHFSPLNNKLIKDLKNN